MLSKFKIFTDRLLSPFGRFFIKVGFMPNVLTTLSLIFALICSFAFYFSDYLFAGLLIIAVGFFDLLDGITARANRMETRFGGFYDAVSDRYTEILILFFASYYINDFLIGFIAITGSLTVSYVRARAEKEGMACNIGFAERAERLMILAICSFFNLVFYGLLIIAILSHLTAIHRFLYVYKEYHNPKSKQERF